MNRMDVLRRYPMMAPYFGRYFCNSDHPSLLLVGESHYLPECSTQHDSPDSWYSGDAKTLNPTEIHWISTARIIEESREKGFKNRSHSIWKNSLDVINKAGPRYEDFTEACDHIAFCNFFLRPAKTGDSLKVTELDSELANLRLQQLLTDYRPDGLVFLSTLASAKWQKPDDLSIPTVTTPHPGCSWWNRTAKAYGGRLGWQLLSDFTKCIWRKHRISSDSED